jgi:hypothetical protein
MKDGVNGRIVKAVAQAVSEVINGQDPIDKARLIESLKTNFPEIF